MTPEAMDQLLAKVSPGVPACVRHPGHPTERFEVIEVSNGRAMIGSQWTSLVAGVEELEPWFRTPPYESLLAAAHVAVKTAAEAAPDYHATKLHVMALNIDSMYGAVVANRQNSE